MMRRLFVIVIDHGIAAAMYIDIPADQTVATGVNGIVGLRIKDDVPELPEVRTAADCSLWDWVLEPLPDDVRVGQVPAPGVVVAIRRSARTLIDLGLVEGESDTSAWSPYLMRVILNATLRRDETWGGRLERFLESTDALYEPAALPRYDVFISFASVDFIAASNLSLQLKSRGHRCFLANSTIRAGQLWADELRDALQTSRGVVVVASAHTVESTWVLGEIGAAWAIGIPLLLGTIDAAQELVSPVRALGTECLPLADLDGLSARIAGWRS